MSQSVNILTIDLEDWFHILDNDATSSVASWEQFPHLVEPMTHKLLDLLSDARVHATFFVLGYVAHKFPELVRQISDLGHDIATHGYGHQLIYEQSEGEFERDLAESLEAINKACGVCTNIYRAPGFSITLGNEWVFGSLAKYGIDVDCSIFPASRAHGGMKSFSASGPCRLSLDRGLVLKELPISTVSSFGKDIIYGGGGYFRVFPWWLIHACFRKNDYNMTLNV